MQSSCLDSIWDKNSSPRRSATKRALCSFSGCKAADLPMQSTVFSSNTEATRYATRAEPVPPDSATTAGEDEAQSNSSRMGQVEKANGTDTRLEHLMIRQASEATFSTLLESTNAAEGPQYKDITVEACGGALSCNCTLKAL